MVAPAKEPFFAQVMAPAPAPVFAPVPAPAPVFAPVPAPAPVIAAVKAPEFVPVIAPVQALFIAPM